MLKFNSVSTFETSDVVSLYERIKTDVTELDITLVSDSAKNGTNGVPNSRSVYSKNGLSDFFINILYSTNGISYDGMYKGQSEYIYSSITILTSLNDSAKNGSTISGSKDKGKSIIVSDNINKLTIYKNTDCILFINNASGIYSSIFIKLSENTGYVVGTLYSEELRLYNGDYDGSLSFGVGFKRTGTYDIRSLGYEYIYCKFKTEVLSNYIRESVRVFPSDYITFNNTNKVNVILKIPNAIDYNYASMKPRDDGYTDGLIEIESENEQYIGYTSTQGLVPEQIITAGAYDFTFYPIGQIDNSSTTNLGFVVRVV